MGSLLKKISAIQDNLTNQLIQINHIHLNQINLYLKQISIHLPHIHQIF